MVFEVSTQTIEIWDSLLYLLAWNVSHLRAGDDGHFRLLYLSAMRYSPLPIRLIAALWKTTIHWLLPEQKTIFINYNTTVIIVKSKTCNNLNKIPRRWETIEPWLFLISSHPSQFEKPIWRLIVQSKLRVNEIDIPFDSSFAHYKQHENACIILMERDTTMLSVPTTWQRILRAKNDRFFSTFSFSKISPP